MRTPAACALALLLTATPAFAQPQAEEVVPVLQGEKATIVFSPLGGYARENYLKRFSTKQGPEWATQNGALAELIRRAPEGSKIRIGAFKLSDEGVVDALLEVAEQKNVEVKLWLKGPPGLTYMVAGHEAIAERVNRYLRRRAQQNKQSSWGDVQVMIGTAAKMSAFGKINDMHTKFGIVGASANHGPGRNHAFLGTSNIGSSSDQWHNENRLFLFEHPAATQRLWADFARLWRHLGECVTYTEGDPSQGSNETPEPQTPEIRLADGSLARERPSDPVQLRFTYEREGNGFHRISDDYVAAFAEARHLNPGETVWVAQFGFGVTRLARAFEQAARDNPAVQFKVMVHMGEGDSSATRRLAQSGLSNLKVYVKWDQSGLKIERGRRPRVPQPGDPGPSLLHHKTLALGSRLLITGSYNFFSDADDQGENIAIVRPHLDASYAKVLRDTHAEFAAMEASGVLIDASKLFGQDGLFEQLQKRSSEDGFLTALQRLSSSWEKPQDFLQRLRAIGGPGLSDLTQQTLDGWIEDLVRFEFAERDDQGRLRKLGNRDEAAHADKPGVRQRAKEPAAARVLEGTLQGNGELDVEGTRYPLPSALASQLDLVVGGRVRVRAVVGAGNALGQAELISPARKTLEGVAGSDTLRVGGATVQARGPLTSALRRARGKRVKVRGWVFESPEGTPREVHLEAVAATVTRETELSYNFAPTGHTVHEGDEVWIVSLTSLGRWAKVEEGSEKGYLSSARLRWGEPVSGINQALDGAGNGD